MCDICIDIECECSKKCCKNIPLKRFGEAEEAGNIISFLASGKASYITGTSMNIATIVLNWHEQ